MDDGLYRGISRRRFIQGAAGLTVLAACGKDSTSTGTTTSIATDVTSTLVQPATKLSGDLKIIQWSHFVPRHDAWFDPFAKDWGTQVGVNVSVDHINQAEMLARAAAEISAGEGHDLIEFIFPPASLEKSVLDLSDLQDEAVKRFGKQVGLCTRSTFNPTTDKYFGFCHGWAPDPGDYRKSLWEKVGLPNGPSTYQELLDGGGRIKAEQGIQLGIGMSNEIDSNMAARALLWSYGASIQDKDMNVVLNSERTIEAVDYMARLFKASMTDEVFGWGAASNNQGLIAGSLSYILNSISAYRSAQTQQPGGGGRRVLHLPLAGARRRPWPASTPSSSTSSPTTPRTSTRPRSSSSTWWPTTPRTPTRASSTTSPPSRRRCPSSRPGSTTTPTAPSRPTSWPCSRTPSSGAPTSATPGRPTPPTARCSTRSSSPR